MARRSHRVASDTPATFCIAWARTSSRAQALASAMDGEAHSYFDLGIRRKPLVPVRYLLSALHTLASLLKRRPGAVIVQVPPVPAALVVWVWAKLTGIPFVLDTHPASFEDARADRLMRPLLSRLIRDAAACLVTTPGLGEVVTRWGGCPAVVHEAPMPWATTAQPRAAGTRPVVLCVCTFAPDEPIEALVTAAQSLPDVAVQVTGDTDRLPETTRRRAPENLEWVGYLADDDYVQALLAADVVVTLTTRTHSVPRSAHEAVDAMRPVVASDQPHMRPLFPYAVFVENRPGLIAQGIRDALANHDELVRSAPEAQQVQHRRWDSQLSDLNRAITGAQPQDDQRRPA